MAAAESAQASSTRPDVFRVGLGSAYLYEAATHLFDDEVFGAGVGVGGGAGVGGEAGAEGGAESGIEGVGGVELAVVPGALEELEDEDAHAVAGGSEGGAEGGSGLALAGAGVDEDEAAAGGFGGVGGGVSR